MTKSMRVTVCQLHNDQSKLKADLAALKAHITQEQSDFLLLPEMPFHSWLAASKDENSKDWDTAIKAHDRQISNLDALGAAAILSTRPICTKAGSRRNQAYLWQQETGAVGFHEKRFLPNEDGYWEATWYDMGPDQFDIARAKDARIGVQICTEMWFFDKSRQYGQQGVDLLCCPRATPHSSVDKWLAGGQAGAVVSGAYHLSSNGYTAKGESADIGGLSWIISPEGDILATTNPDSPFATIEIDLDFSKHSKSTYPRYVKT